MFHGFFPTFKWLYSPQTNKNDLTARDIYVLFSYSDNQRSITPHGTLGVELSAWLAVIEDITREYQTLPAIIGNVKPLL